MRADGLHRVYRVAKAQPEGRVGVTLVFQGTLAARPGQFVMVWLPGIGERPFSVTDDDPFSVTVADVGPFTHQLCALAIGDRAWIRGPFGRGFPASGRRHLLVAGGSGAASLALLARVVLGRGDEAVVALGARDAEGLMLAWQFQSMGGQVMLATDDGSVGHHGTVLSAVESLLSDRWPDTVYGCGPEPMLLALARRAKSLGLPSWMSLERVMKCGLGVCGNCHCGDRLVCRDGPVFPGSEVLRCIGDGVPLSEPRNQV